MYYRSVQNTLDKDLTAAQASTKAFQSGHRNVFGEEDRGEKKRENLRMRKKSSNMTSWVKCPPSMILGSYNLGLQDTITRFSQYILAPPVPPPDVEGRAASLTY